MPDVKTVSDLVLVSGSKVTSVRIAGQASHVSGRGWQGRERGEFRIVLAGSARLGSWGLAAGGGGRASECGWLLWRSSELALGLLREEGGPSRCFRLLWHEQGDFY